MREQVAAQAGGRPSASRAVAGCGAQATSGGSAAVQYGAAAASASAPVGRSRRPAEMQLCHALLGSLPRARRAATHPAMQ